MLKKIREYISELSNHSSDEDNSKEPETSLINNACAALLIETAFADQVFNEAELNSMKETLIKVYEMESKEVEEIINASKKTVSESTSLYEYTRLLNDLCNYEDKIKLINNLWIIAFADKQLDKYEEYLIRKIADLLHVSHRDFIKEKLKVKKKINSR